MPGSIRRIRFFLKEKNLSGNQYNQLFKYGRECDFFDSAGNIKINLHWQLGGPFRRPYDYEFCKDRLIKIPFNSQKINCLSKEDTLLHLCVNGTHDIWSSLEKILCVADYITQNSVLNWERVQELSGRLYCKRMLLFGLFLVEDMFEVRLSGKIFAKIKNDPAVVALLHGQQAENCYEVFKKKIIARFRLEQDWFECKKPWDLSVKVEGRNKNDISWSRIKLPINSFISSIFFYELTLSAYQNLCHAMNPDYSVFMPPEEARSSL